MSSFQAPGKPPVIGDLVRDRQRLEVWCNKCHRQALIPPEEAVRMLGPGTTFPMLGAGSSAPPAAPAGVTARSGLAAAARSRTSTPTWRPTAACPCRSRSLRAFYRWEAMRPRVIRHGGISGGGGEVYDRVLAPSWALSEGAFMAINTKGSRLGLTSPVTPLRETDTFSGPRVWSI